ncbi:putative histone deacetylase 8-like [Capsicum annuum]|nr:putative histone deacetylase 8-like [Capsicum annuum]KAF3630729.1 putative histone deacetylase 8-like [Capsicum annuum]
MLRNQRHLRRSPRNLRALSLSDGSKRCSFTSPLYAFKGLIVDDAFQVAAIIEKLPPIWKEFKNYLKHKRKEITVKDLIVRLCIEEDNKAAERRSKENSTINGAHIVEDDQNNSKKRKKVKQGSNQPKKKFMEKCFNCGKIGHQFMDCCAPKKGKKKDQAIMWIDSGATRHVCANKDLFSSFTPAQVEEMIYMANSAMAKRHNTGTEFLSSEIITVDYVKSKDNVSDPLTKDLSREGVERTSKGMGLRPRTSQHGELLKWPLKENDPCGSPAWPHVLSSSDRVAQIQHKDPFDQDNIVNITVLEDPMMYTAQSDPQRLTNNFAPDNELGRDNFGVVYKGLIEDGIQIAVKRRESTIINSKALEEFQAKIVVLSKNRKKLEDSIINVLEHPKMYIANSRNLVISTQYLWRVTNNFVTENGLGHGGFGVVYKGVTEDESQIIVKRIESSIINHKKLDKFQTSFSLEDPELRTIIPEKKINIALDVSREMEYLHNLTRYSFIHRDHKSPNIFLDDDFKAKIFDFELVKLITDKESTEKVTTKIDVFCFGVVLMELVTGLIVLDENRSEETRHLVE